ncbi:MAG: flagellar filament capping protein FliD [Alteromonadaceae bacterium]|nr:flagellar filament capping protein FliD [Alteromonadaceae bacterium]
MGIQSLGVGSGLALDDLVTQLIDAERTPKQTRLDEQEETLDATISAIGSLKSKVEEFQDTAEELKNDFNLNAREPQIDHPNSDLEEDDTGPFSAEASTSALEGDYQIAVTQLATGTEFTTQDNVFSASSDVLTNTETTVNFGFVNSSDSFSVTVTSGMTLQEYVNAINSNSNNFQSDGTTPLVTATLLDTGTVGPKLILRSSITGTGDELQIDGGGNADLANVASTNLGVGSTTLTQENATNAIAYIDGIQVTSASNEFENIIPNVSFEAFELSETTTDTDLVAENGGFQYSKLTIGNDKTGLENKIRDFIDAYNTLTDEISTLTRYGLSDLEEDGALAGDFMVRGLQSGLANLISDQVSGNTLGSLAQIGVTFDDDGKLEITAVDEFGSGSGEDKLSDALDDYFDEVANLFTDSSEGIGLRVYDFLYEYTTFGGLLSEREDALDDEKDLLADEREAFELRMLNFEQIQRDKYIALDRTVSSLNQTGAALLASLPQF